MLNLTRILVATDFSDASAKALSYAVSLAERLGVPVTVVHAFAIPIYGLLDGVLIATSDEVARLSSAAQRGLDHAVAPYESAGVAVDAVLRTGEAWEEIEMLAAERKAGLIVLGTHGRTGVAHALLGSVAEKVVRTSSIPVLTVRGSKVA